MPCRGKANTQPQYALFVAFCDLILCGSGRFLVHSQYDTRHYTLLLHSYYANHSHVGQLQLRPQLVQALQGFIILRS